MKIFVCQHEKYGFVGIATSLDSKNLSEDFVVEVIFDGDRSAAIQVSNYHNFGSLPKIFTEHGWDYVDDFYHEYSFHTVVLERNLANGEVK